MLEILKALALCGLVSVYLLALAGCGDKAQASKAGKAPASAAVSPDGTMTRDQAK